MTNKKRQKQFHHQDPESGVHGDDNPSNLLKTIQTLRRENKNLRRILVGFSLVLVLSIGGLVGAVVVLAVNSTTAAMQEDDAKPQFSTSTDNLYEPTTTTTTTTTNSTNNGNSIGDATQEADNNNNNNNNTDTGGDKPDVAGEPPSGVQVISASDLFD
jgi:hypothetical protein